MPNSPINPHSPIQNPKNQKRLCDFCGESVALIYCRADCAKLCLSCDREVHSTNQLFTKHTRFQLCDSCNSSSATVLCATDRSVLCQNCDYELHNLPGSSLVHDRRPLEGFSGRPSVSELSALVGLEDLDCKSLVEIDAIEGFDGFLLDGLDEENDEFSDFLVWDTPSVVSIDELIVSTDKSHNFQAMVVPPLPKDRNLSCGQHKQEIIHQLCQLAKSEPTIKQDSDALVRDHIVADVNQKDFMEQHTFQAYQHDEEHAAFQRHEVSSYTWGNDANEAANDSFFSSALLGSHIEENVLNTDTHSSICSMENLATDGWNSQNPIGTESSGLPPKVTTHEFSTVERDSALSRYKEKKRTRRYSKHIRYESRKVQAENRIRIKGRFAKINHSMNEA